MKFGTRVFGVAYYESVIRFSKFNMADSRWWLSKLKKPRWYSWKYIFGGFWGRWLWIRHQVFKIQNGGFKMAAAEIKNRNNIHENIYSGVFGVADYGSLIRFKIQNGGFKMTVAKMKNRYNIRENIYSGVFGDADYWSRIKFKIKNVGFKMAAAKMKKTR